MHGQLSLAPEKKGMTTRAHRMMQCDAEAAAPEYSPRAPLEC